MSERLRELEEDKSRLRSLVGELIDTIHAEAGDRRAVWLPSTRDRLERAFAELEKVG